MFKFGVLVFGQCAVTFQMPRQYLAQKTLDGFVLVAHIYGFLSFAIESHMSNLNHTN